MKYNKRQIGTRYEQIAGKYLESRGYKIVEYNYRCPPGEVDIIAKDGEYLVFCEVKYRADQESGYPQEAVNVKKQRVLSKCALWYTAQKRIADVPCRFDVVGIMGDKLTLIQNAFDYIE